MIVYHATKKGFTEDVFNGEIANEIDKAFFAHLGRYTSPNEYASWKNSMMYMNNVINTDEIPDDSCVAIEYQIPLTSKRVDFIISGLNGEHNGQMIIIELKQWEQAKLTNKQGVVKTNFQRGESETTHPSYQAWSYAFMLENYNEKVRDEQIRLNPCAYLHNYQQDDIIANSFYQEFIDKAPLFFKSDARKLREFIKTHIKYGDKDNIIWFIENGTLKPSKQLADSLCSMLKGKQEFVLLDDQKIVYETALEMAKLSMKEDRKYVLIVEGGPGTGKSVVAVNLLVELTNRGMSAQYVSKNAAPRDVYSAKLSGSFKKSYINNLFVGSGSFIDMGENTIDNLIVDEAHRLNLKSGLYSNLGENQIVEIIKSARFSVFFVDDRQKIHIKDIGSKSKIAKSAESCKAIVRTAKLSSQFRCNGSDGYLNWLDNTLQITETANIHLSQEDYDFRIFSDPNKLFKEIELKNRLNNKSRVVAGYCWNWNSKSDSTQYDIIIPEFDFKKQWNLNSDGNKWIIGETSIQEIGCIHTCQGLELDYVGVIVGNDLRYEKDKVVTDVTKRSVNDRSVLGFKGLLKQDRPKALQEVDEIIKNTYRTLMTRGLKGCYVYFCDSELAAYVQKQLLPPKLKEEKEIRIEADVNDDVKYVDYLPFYSIKDACAHFGEGEIVSELGWIKIQETGKLDRNMFVVQAIGDSMEPVIRNGDFCLFRANPSGRRLGKIVLAQHANFYDSHNAGNYSIKTYSSKKGYNELGDWEHEHIILNPKNTEYNPIVLDVNNEDFRIVGEFTGIVNP